MAERYSVHISADRYRHILDAAKEGSGRVRDALTKTLFLPDKDGRRRYELRGLAGDTLNIMMAADPDELAKHVLRAFSQTLMDSIHYAMLYGHERTKSHNLDMHIPGTKVPETEMEVHAAPPGGPKVEISLGEEQTREAAALLSKGIRQAQGDQPRQPSIEGPSAKRNTPTPARKPMPSVRGPGR
jgi:hypothetical protein